MDGKYKKSPFLEEIRQIMRVQHYAIRTEQSYIDWIRRFILFHGKRHPADMGESEVAEFLTHLSVNRNVAPATQGQALNALVFLYRKVIKRPLDQIQGIVRSKKKEKFRWYSHSMKWPICFLSWKGFNGWQRVCCTAQVFVTPRSSIH